MPHQFLHHFQISTVRLQPTGKAAAEGVPPDRDRDTRCLSRGAHSLLQQTIGPAGLPARSSDAGKDPVIGSFEWGQLPPCEQVLQGVVVNRKRLLGILRLAPANYLTIDGPSNMHFLAEEIHILPLERQEFTDPQTG